MIYNYYDKNSRQHYRTYCDSCHALIGDTAPMKEHLPRSNEISDVCPLCQEKIHDPATPKWNPPIR
jgi:hypothetical protein